MWRLALLLCQSFLYGRAQLHGIGVCTKANIVSEPVTQRVYVSRIVHYTYNCWGGIRTCRASRALFDWQTTTEYITKQFLVQYCCEGYTLGSRGDICVPVCDPDCVHGQCVAPQRCVCDHGYRRAHSPHACVPVCDPPCLHGWCDAPDVCQCEQGYNITVRSGLCEPVCSVDCSHGKCVSPEECVCDPGFTKDAGNKCSPRCDKGCTHGVCSSPEKCDCLPGYRNKESDESNGCEPVCNFPCTNGICSAPNVCTCNVGYEFLVDKCAPICDEECNNGYCSEPNTCSCNEGYSAGRKDRFLCNAVCNNSCGNGVCVAPDTCLCNKGYKLSSEGTCEAYCSNECNNGVCSQPEICTCNPGYVNVPVPFDDSCKQSCVESCIEQTECSEIAGCDCSTIYDRTAENQCVPFCSKGCEYGECVGPEKCACSPGYEKDLHQPHICRPVCPQECVFGECLEPNVCACQNGYTPSDNPYKCSPICSETCVNAKCVAPNTCECILGFIKDENESNVCVTDCSLPCMNGICVGSDVCRCNHGYVQSTLDHVCVPVCEECNNGSCIAPGLCFCDSGFENPLGDSQTCVPHCESHCENGICSAPDTCTCIPGYRRDQSDKNICYPECSKFCTNGNCTLPDVCECYSGYYKDPDNWNICLPVCSEGCVNGVCSAPENCSCLWGFSSEFEPSNCNIVDDSNLTNSWTFQIMPTTFVDFYLLVWSKIESFHLQDSFFLKHIIKSIEIGDYIEVQCENTIETDNNCSTYNSTNFTFSCSLSKHSIDELQFQREETSGKIIKVTEATGARIESEQTTSETEAGITDWTQEQTMAPESQAITFRVTLNLSSFIIEEKITPEYFSQIQALPLKEEFHLCHIRNTRSWSEREVLRFYLCKEEMPKSYKPIGLVIKPFVLAVLVSIGVSFTVFTITIIVYRHKAKKSAEFCSIDHEELPPCSNVYTTRHKLLNSQAARSDVIMLRHNQDSTDV